MTDKHDGEELTQKDEETLIDTSPVGVVFDAVAGTPKSFDREAHRIIDYC